MALAHCQDSMRWQGALVGHHDLQHFAGHLVYDCAELAAAARARRHQQIEQSHYRQRSVLAESIPLLFQSMGFVLS